MFNFRGSFFLDSKILCTPFAFSNTHHLLSATHIICIQQYTPFAFSTHIICIQQYTPFAFSNTYRSPSAIHTILFQEYTPFAFSNTHHSLSAIHTNRFQQYTPFAFSNTVYVELLPLRYTSILRGEKVQELFSHTESISSCERSMASVNGSANKIRLK